MLTIKKSYFLFACTFFFSLGGNILNFSLIYRLTDRFLFSPGQLGNFLAIGQVFYFIGCNLYFRFGSALNPAKIVPAATLVVLLSSFALGYGSNQALVYASFWLYQIGNSIYWPPIIAWITGGLAGKDLNREISIYNRSWMAALLIGPLVAGTLYRMNSTVNFIIVNFCFFMASLLLFIMRRYFRRGDLETESLISKTGDDPDEDRLASLLAKAKDKRLDLYRYRGYIGVFCAYVLLGVLVNIIPLHIRDGLGFTEQSAGLALFFRCAAGFVGFTILARFTAWHFRSWWFVALQGGLILCAILFLFAGSSIAFFCAIAALCGLMNSGCSTTSVFYSGATGTNPKKNVALHEIFISIGTALGAAGGGFFYQRFRITGLSVALAALLGTVLCVNVILGRKERSAEPLEVK